MDKVIDFLTGEIKWADDNNRKITFILVIPYEEGKPGWKGVQRIRDKCGVDAARPIVTYPKGTFAFQSPVAWKGKTPTTKSNKPMYRLNKAEKVVPEYNTPGQTKPKKKKLNMSTSATSTAKFVVGIIDCSSRMARQHLDKERYSNESLAALLEWDALHPVLPTKDEPDAALTMGPGWQRDDTSLQQANELRTPEWILRNHDFPWDQDWHWMKHPDTRPELHAHALSLAPPMHWYTGYIHRDIQNLPSAIGIAPPNGYKRAIMCAYANMWTRLEASSRVEDTRTVAQTESARRRRQDTTASEIMSTLGVARSAMGRPQNQMPQTDEYDSED